MKSTETMLPSQPSTYGQLIQHSFRLYAASFSKIIVLALFLSIIVFIPRLISDLIGQDLFLNLPLLSVHRLWLLLVNLAGLALFVAILWHMHCTIRALHEPLMEDLRVGIQKVLYIFLATIIQGAIILAVTAIIFGLQVLFYQFHMLFLKNIFSALITSVLFIGQFALITYISTLFIFFVPLIAIENKNILIAIEKSVRLGWNHWWRVFSVQVTPWLCYLILLILLKYELNVDIHIYFVEKMPHPLWTTGLNIAIFALFIPWVAALLLVQLQDLELRKNE